MRDEFLKHLLRLPSFSSCKHSGKERGFPSVGRSSSAGFLFWRVLHASAVYTVEHNAFPTSSLSVFPLDPPPPSRMQCATLLAPSPKKLFTPLPPMGGSPFYLSIDASLLTLPYAVWPPLSSSSAVCLPTHPPNDRPTDRKLQTRLRTLFYSLPLVYPQLPSRKPPVMNGIRHNLNFQFASAVRYCQYRPFFPKL